MLSVGSIMTRDPLTVPPEWPIGRARSLMRDHSLRHLLVVDRERLVGILSERDSMERPEPRPRQRTRDEEEPASEVRDRMSVSVETVAVDESVPEACRRLLERRVGCLPVVQGGRPAGVLSESDFLRFFVRVSRFAGHDAALDPAVEEVMSRDVVTIAPDRSAAEAFELCRTKGIRHLPVVHDGWLVGMASDRDLLPVVGGGDGDVRRVEDLMTVDFVSVAPEARLSEAAECMLRQRFHGLPVLVNGALKGVVTSADVLRTLCDLDEQVLDSAWASEQALSANREEE